MVEKTTDIELPSLQNGGIPNLDNSATWWNLCLFCPYYRVRGALHASLFYGYLPFSWRGKTEAHRPCIDCWEFPTIFTSTLIRWNFVRLSTELAI